MEKDNQLVTDLYVKPTDTHQDLHSSSCHVSYCKKSKSFNQALRLNRIYSENAFFGKRCNELARCMAKRKRLQWHAVEGISTWKMLRSEVLNKQKHLGNNSRFVFNITYHAVLSKLKNVLSEIHLLLSVHGKVLERIPIAGFRRAKSLKDIIVKAKVGPF